VSSLFKNTRFNGFGPDPLRECTDSPPFEHVAAPKRRELRKLVRQFCPRLPGVYGMLDMRGRVIYVGKAKSLRQRLLSYFRRGSRDEKAGRIIEHTQSVVWEPGHCEFGVLIRELEMIRRWQPRYNVRGMPGRDRQIYLCLGRSPAPFFYVSREPTGKELACYGPVKGMAMAEEAARRLNDVFKLRDCSKAQTMRFSDQRELFPILHTAGCLRYELKTCLGPCAGFTSRSTYGRHTRAVRAFLDGKDPGPIASIEAEMNAASDRHEFERAAALRNKLLPLLWLRQKLVWVDQARQKHSCIYPQKNSEDVTIWYLIRRGRVRAAVASPIDKPSARIAIDAIAQVFADEPSLERLVPEHLVDHVLLVASWFRRFPDEEQKALSPTDAMAMCGALLGAQVRSRSA
jgi:excinuclease ABC subunit C